MLFVNVNLNLKQARISIKLPEKRCKNKINLEIRQTGELIISNLNKKLIIGSNLIKFIFKPLTMRQFNYSKVNNEFYLINFVIECDFEFTYSNDKCLLNMPSDHEMAIDWAYCCGDNQGKHLQNLHKSSKCSKSNKNQNKLECSNQQDKQNKSNQLNESSQFDPNKSDDVEKLNQLFTLFSKQKLFSKFLIESTNQEYLVLQLLNNRCLIAFNSVNELDIDLNDDESRNEIHQKIEETTQQFDLKESIFVEFCYLDFNRQPDEVRQYRHSFEYEFIKLDSELFNRLFKQLYQVNKSILPLTTKYKPFTSFSYSYLVYKS